MANVVSYDYIVVGAGAAGCVIANRLSANGNYTVLVLEAGTMDTNPDIADAGGFVRLWNTDQDWQIKTTPQQGLFNREIVINQGKVVGGSSSINAMMYVRGNRKNFDAWSRMGATGWSYEEVLPFFKKLENFELGASAYHNNSGELTITICPDEVMRSQPFLEGATQVGYNGPDHDYNAGKQENGAGLLQFHIDANGKRESGASAFLHPVLGRKNVTLIVSALVTKIDIKDQTAYGVQYVQNGETKQAIATKEIILSAGAFASPKLLLLSGIGPAADLQALGINVLKDLPGVGKNLQDHLQLPLLFKNKQALPQTTLLTGNVLFVNTKTLAGEAPDLQINFTPSMPAPLAPILPDFGPVCIFLAILVQPESRGEVKLTSSRPTDPLLVDPQYLSTNGDVNVLREAIGIVRKIAASPAFSALNAGEMAPGQGDVEEYIRSQATTIWHPAGTCKMGIDDMAVVDSRLRLHGIANLRVADASVMPAVTSGNTVASCFMIGEKAAEMILADAKK